MEIKGRTVRQKRLIQLETLLNIEIPVLGTLILIWWILPKTILIFIFAVAAILFSIFTIALVVLLLLLRKFGWLSTLIIFVILPLCFIHPLYHESVMYPAHYIAPLGFFAFYSILLRVSMKNWSE